MFKARDIHFSYFQAGHESPILKGVNLEIERGDFASIQGPSGSGKSTLFYILGCLLRPTRGEIWLEDRELTRLSDLELARFRNQDLGFVFQQFHLLPRATVLENIMLPTRFGGSGARDAEPRARQLAERVGIGDLTHRLPNQLSGGQMQRVAIARSLMNEPKILLADEPTGNLDSRNAEGILRLFQELNEEGRTILLVTHDSGIADRCRSKILVRDGLVEKTFHAPVPSKHAHFTVKPSEWETQLRPNAWRMVLRSIPIAYRNLRRNKAKSLLTMLGVIIGVAAVLAMITLGNFAKRRILESYQTLGVNRVALRGWDNNRQKSYTLNTVRFESFDERTDIEPLRAIFPEILHMSPVLSAWDSLAQFGGIELSDRVRIIGVNAEYFPISNMHIKEGMQFYPHHVTERSPVCVLGADVAQKFFAGRSSLGNIVTLVIFKSFVLPCKVVGVLQSQTSNSEWSRPNDQIFVPLSYYQSGVASGYAAEIHEVNIQARQGADPALLGQKIKGYFFQKYGNSGTFIADADSKLLGQMKKFLNIFTLLLICIAAISLLVGGIGINNMMLISVTERLKEIGLRKSLGATNLMIRTQILTESMLLCFVAGLIGVAVGFLGYQGLIYAATQLVPNVKFEWVFEPAAVLVSMLSIVVVGVGSGFAPAIKAEKLEVIEALRSE